MAPEEFSQQFAEAAEEFRTFMEERHGVKPEWTFESLPAVDDFLTAIRPELETPEDKQALVALAGAYFGELYVRNWNCTWHNEGNPETLANWSICIDGLPNGPSYVRVYRKVEKFLEHGPVESLFALYQSTHNYRQRNLSVAKPATTGTGGPTRGGVSSFPKGAGSPSPVPKPSPTTPSFRTRP